MFGIYENFPDIYHGIARFICASSNEKIQEALIQSLYRINQEQGGPDLPEFSRHNTKVHLEFGIADGLTFNYLDHEIFRDCLDKCSGLAFTTLDFLCIVRYYLSEKDKQSPLRFDYHMLRFLFGENEVELRVYHERGTRRLSIIDLIKFLVRSINRELSRKKLGTLKKSYVRVL